MVQADSQRADGQALDDGDPAFSIMTWLIAIGVVIMLGAVAGAVWDDRRNS
jgi:hypothetical protein